MPELDHGPSEAGCGVPESVWRRIAASPRRLLMLDYDGTLAPYTTDRAHAFPSARTIAALEAIAARPSDSVVIVSGRPLSELERLLPVSGVDYVGEHGWEEHAGGERLQYAVPNDASLRLGLALRMTSLCGWERYIEPKRASIVLHTRGVQRSVSEHLTANCASLWRLFSNGGALALDENSAGLELRASTRNKGLVARERLTRAGEHALAVYIGDEHADELAFEALRPRGITVRVGPLENPTTAEWRLPSVEDVTSFLETWRDLPGSEHPGPDTQS